MADRRGITHRLHRRSDPGTSREAAEIITAKDLGEKQRQALRILKENPGRTSKELERISGHGDGEVRKRLNDLRLAGRAYKGQKRHCKITKRMAYTWHAGRSPDSLLGFNYSTRRAEFREQATLFSNPLPHERK